MNAKHFLIFDIETVHDKDAIEKAECNDEIINYESYIEYMKEKNNVEEVFVKLPYHKIIALSLAQFSIPDFSYKEYSFSFLDNSEEEIIEKFWLILDFYFRNNTYPFIVSFNGKKFDLNVLMLRTIKYIQKFNDNVLNGIKTYYDSSDKWENNRPNYMSLYSKYNIDIMNVFNSGNAYYSLSSISSLFNIPIKTNFKSEEINDIYYSGDIDLQHKIMNHCLEDLNSTFLFLLVYLLLKGEITIDNFNFLLKDKIKFIGG